MRILLSAAAALVSMSVAAHAEIITIINEHPSASIVHIEVVNEEYMGVRNIIEEDGGAIAPGESALLPIDRGEGGCEYALIATFDDDEKTSIQARGVDLCEDRIWTLMDGDYRID